MFCSVLSAAISGIDALPVHVEADVSDGMPLFTIVGFISSQVREAQDRVRTALRNQGLVLPPKRITLNLAPGYLRKDGTRFDLPIAAAILLAVGRIPATSLDGRLLIGELHLDGCLGGVTGILPSVLAARDMGCTACILPLQNASEASVVSGIRIIGIRHLSDLIAYASSPESPLPACQPPLPSSLPPSPPPDFSEIQGQDMVKRASLIAASGFHNILLSGPPGSGKSMTASRIPSILPPLTEDESLEISKIYSVAGLLSQPGSLPSRRPFRSPHHTISPAALCGGGRIPIPGEITLSHRGVLFLDELPEMKPSTLDMLRQPLQEKQITISRLDGNQTFPASFLLVAAMNPCPCGYWPDRSRCTCSPPEIRRYQSRISQAILDRIDIRCEVPAADYEDLTSARPDSLSSARLLDQVMKAVCLQKDRYAEENFLFNSELPSHLLGRYCPLTSSAEQTLRMAFRTLHLSARSYHHTLKLARTIADLDSSPLLSEGHISESLCFRSRLRAPEA